LGALIIYIALAIRFGPSLEGLSSDWFDNLLTGISKRIGSVGFCLFLAALLLGLAMLYVRPDTHCRFLGGWYALMASNPFELSADSEVGFRRLTPTISYLIGLRGDNIIITMGDVPFIKKTTYTYLVESLSQNDLMILGFSPKDKKKYGVLEIENGSVRKITEWKYWCEYPAEIQASLSICNSGIYAVRRETLIEYLPLLARNPQKVIKEVNGKMVEIEEFFITDLVEYMVEDGLPVGYVIAEEEIETMGIDDMSSLEMAQELFRQKVNYQF